MAASESQVIDQQEFTSLLDYEFTGDDSTVERKRGFLTAYRNEGSIYHAALAVGIHRTTVYKWLERDSAFVQALDDSREDNYDQAETSVFKKALAGDSLLLMFYLKAHRHKFRDKVTIDVESVRDEIQQRMEQLGLQRVPQMITAGSDSGLPCDFLPCNSTQSVLPSARIQKDSSDHNSPQD